MNKVKLNPIVPPPAPFPPQLRMHQTIILPDTFLMQ